MNDKYQFVDTSGHKLFSVQATPEYPSSKVVLVVFDAENEKSFTNVKTQWLSNVQTMGSKSLAKHGVILVGVTKSIDKNCEFNHKVALLAKGFGLQGKVVYVRLPNSEGKQELLDLIDQLIARPDDLIESSGKEIDQIIQESLKEVVPAKVEAPALTEIEEIIKKF